MPKSEIELLRRVANGEIFARTSDGAASLDEFDAVAKVLFALARRGDVELPPGRMEKDYMTSRGAYRAIAARITRQGRERLERDATDVA